MRKLIVTARSAERVRKDVPSATGAWKGRRSPRPEPVGLCLIEEGTFKQPGSILPTQGQGDMRPVCGLLHRCAPV